MAIQGNQPDRPERDEVTGGGEGGRDGGERQGGRDGELRRLIAIMARLRDPVSGCPWDIEQDFASIAPYTIEEAYEVADAIERCDWAELRGELGDLLFQVVYHARMAEEAGHFRFDDVVRTIADKMVARHPHVFADESRDKSAAEQTRDWERIKAAERRDAAGGAARTLDGVARGLPALLRALKLQKRAARVGFDWPSSAGVLDKITEELRELDAARADLGAAEIREEFGDLLFAITNLGRHLGLDPEDALRAANDKFTRRFNAVEERLQASGNPIALATLDEMEAAWREVKARERKGR